MSSQNFKRFSVFISICLAALSLTVGAIATLRPLEPATLKCEFFAPKFSTGHFLALLFLNLLQINDAIQILTE
jgi:hypothetical protein